MHNEGHERIKLYNFCKITPEKQRATSRIDTPIDLYCQAYLVSEKDWVVSNDMEEYCQSPVTGLSGRNGSGQVETNRQAGGRLGPAKAGAKWGFANSHYSIPVS